LRARCNWWSAEVKEPFPFHASVTDVTGPNPKSEYRNPK
jgi:hypothetical protein